MGAHSQKKKPTTKPTTKQKQKNPPKKEKKRKTIPKTNQPINNGYPFFATQVIKAFKEL